jgi:hypothetical protein
VQKFSLTMGNESVVGALSTNVVGGKILEGIRKLRMAVI